MNAASPQPKVSRLTQSGHRGRRRAGQELTDDASIQNNSGQPQGLAGCPVAGLACGKPTASGRRRRNAGREEAPCSA
jgi:hypothetical protein